ncbi:MAG: nitrous oxide reductase accessory protein NosL [Cyclobacteriaceae bacterium]|nr:nitrous oxide reductase accessory protein NosL [Cyclobacteriaceae bacterium]
MKNSSLLFLLYLFIFSSCSIELEKINYGNEACHFCKMTIVDQQHASEAVTTKGKVFKYDALECMINDLKQKKDVEMALLYVNDYSSPGKLIEVQTSTFLISEKIKSPMGAYLSAFGNKEEAQKVLNSSGGNLYSWEEIQNQIK